MNKTYLIYDGRAQLGDTDDATVIDTADSMQEAKQILTDLQNDSCIYEYDVTDKNELINEKRIWV